MQFVEGAVLCSTCTRVVVKKVHVRCLISWWVSCFESSDSRTTTALNRKSHDISYNNHLISAKHQAIDVWCGLWPLSVSCHDTQLRSKLWPISLHRNHILLRCVLPSVEYKVSDTAIDVNFTCLKWHPHYHWLVRMYSAPVCSVRNCARNWLSTQLCKSIQFFALIWIFTISK